MKHHEIKNQHDHHIIDEKIREEIIFALDHDMDHTYFESVRIDIKEDKRTDKERVTIVKVEGIYE